MQERHVNRELYFEEQSRTAHRFYQPYLRRYGMTHPRKVLEIGCGEGGNLLPFAEDGCQVYGMDLCRERIEQARSFFRQRGFCPTLVAADALTYDWGEERFDLILLHDVIEHVSDKERLLQRIHDLLLPEGMAFVGFPAWQMPFGGHQQIARGGFAFCPWVHLLPMRIYVALLRWSGQREETVRELKAIKETRCTIEHFQKLARRQAFQILNRTLFLVNPHYEVKFRLKPVVLPAFMTALPWIRNFFCSGSFYLIRPLR